MKNLLIYLSPSKDFSDDEHKRSVKIQIENSFGLGWKLEDIMLVTNFPYEYNGIKAIVIGDENYCSFFAPTTKVYAIVGLFKAGLIKKGLYWYHDFDCFELNPIVESEVRKEMGECNLGISNYGQKPRLCSASIFFDEKAEDIFDHIKHKCAKNKVNEEVTLMRMVYNSDNPFSIRTKIVNTTYAFHKFNIVKTYETTIKPIRAAHFHLTPDKYDFYVKGNNKLFMPLIPYRLVKIFNKHGFTG